MFLESARKMRRFLLSAILSSTPCASLSLPASAARPAGDHIVSAISADGSISAKAIVSTALCSETARLQGLGGLAAAALGRALTCCLLVAEGCEPDEVFQVRFDGDGPLRGVLALANGKREARGYVGNPAVTLPPNADGKFDVGGGVGKGTLQVVRIKNLPGETVPRPYTSVVEIVSGEIPEDINLFLAESEQTEGALAAGVFVQGVDREGVDRNGERSNAADVRAAGGWKVALLPGADEATVAILLSNLQTLDRSPTQMIRDGLGAEDIVRRLLDGLEPTVFKPARPPLLSESCPCCDERVWRTIKLLPRNEIDEIIESSGERVEVKCEFCGRKYGLTPDQIEAELARS